MFFEWLSDVVVGNLLQTHEIFHYLDYQYSLFLDKLKVEHELDSFSIRKLKVRCLPTPMGR